MPSHYKKSKSKRQKEYESESESDLDIYDKVVKGTPISRVLYNIITSDFVKGLSYDMAKFVAMFLLTSYLKGEPLPIHLFNNSINREVREASNALYMATQTDTHMDDENEYKLPIILSALRSFEESKTPETIDVDETIANFTRDYNDIFEEFTNLNPKETAKGLQKKIKGGGHGRRNSPIGQGGTDRFNPNNISNIIAEAIAYARQNAIPPRILNKVLTILSRAVVCILIYGVLHAGATSIQYLITHYMNYKAMFTHYMEDGKRTPKTAKDFTEDAEHYKSWASENIGGKLPKDLKETEVDEEIKEIEESSWFKRFYKKTIKPAAKKIYDVATSDEAITAAKITAQILILSLLMYAANEARGAMYNYIGLPAYDRTMRALNDINDTNIHSDVFAPKTILTNVPKKEALLDVALAYDPTSINQNFRPSKGRLEEMSKANRDLFFRENPDSSMIRHFLDENEFKDADEDARYAEMRDELVRNAAAMPSKEDRLARMKSMLDRANEETAHRIAEDARMANEARMAEAKRIANILEFYEGSEMHKEDILAKNIRMAPEMARMAAIREKAARENELLWEEKDRKYREELAERVAKDAAKRQRKAEKDAKEAKILADIKEDLDRRDAQKKAQKKAQKNSKGNGLSVNQTGNKFYEFIASDDAKNMAKATAVGLIGTVLTILASQGGKKNNIKSEPLLSITHKPTEDLSYFGIPDY